MKLLSVKIDDDLHKQLRIYALNHDRTVTDIVVELVKKELKTKKEQTQQSWRATCLLEEQDIGEPTSICSVTYFLKIVKFERRKDYNE